MQDREKSWKKVVQGGVMAATFAGFTTGIGAIRSDASMIAPAPTVTESPTNLLQQADKDDVGSLVQPFLTPTYIVFPTLTPTPTPTRTPTPTNTPEPTHTPTPTFTKEQAFFGRHKEEKKLVLEVVGSEDILRNIKVLSAEQRIADMEMYFNVYKAAEEKYGIPWYLLYIIHAHETAVSRDPYPDPYYDAELKRWRGLFYGAMQRYPVFYPDSYVDEAVSGWEFLMNTQKFRYTKPPFETHDVREIFFAARKINKDARDIRGVSPRQAIKKALLSYSAEVHAYERQEAFDRAEIILGRYGLVSVIALPDVD